MKSLEQIAANRVRYRALHDGLTLLPNGRYFRTRLEPALGRGEPCRIRDVPCQTT